MATKKQEKAVDNLVGNGGNVTQAMIDAGYSENTANTPQKLTESVGFQQLCEDRGLTNELLLDSLVEDIKSKKKNRKAELELGFKLTRKLDGKDEEPKDKGSDLHLHFHKDEKVVNIINEAEEKLKQQLKDEI